MRIILVTGSGGAGRTTVAAATALAEARAGRRVLLVSEDVEPLPAQDGLRVLRPRPAGDFRREFLALQARSSTALDLLGAVPFEEAELTELPGSRPFALLRALRDAAEGDHELAVVDLPPLAEALALLALPEQLRRYLRRLLPPERQAARALRPMLAQLAGVPMPAQWLYETTGRWETELAAVQAVVEAPTTSVRLVLEPGPAAVRALRTARLGLALQRLPLDSVVANRLLPAGSEDPWLAGLTAQQHRHLAELRTASDTAGASGAAGHGGTVGRVDELPHLGRDPRGPEDLVLLAPARRPAAAPDPVPAWTVEDRREEDGVLVWHIGLPGAVKEELSLVRRGDELLLTVGPFRRNVPLPAALRRCTVTGAGLVEGDLRVRFTPDPGLWPRTP
ncbi:arsenite-transporting ATPase [Streptomyces sp. PvR006]|uniref:ArsA family ATPase n=1 Tax=Streptomyces sp. PvR006 TaxID=2817860 RepID=UPI001AE621A1|nr:ArsA-related P-loop ATPase [Streptomyces sp. PvR006]MBP2581559.1 arsenite-transporting ATPase [Streptomyces sp. PvR006]